MLDSLFELFERDDRGHRKNEPGRKRSLMDRISGQPETSHQEPDEPDRDESSQSDKPRKRSRRQRLADLLEID